MRLFALAPVLVWFAPLVAQEKVDFARQVVPILVGRCIECHGPDKEKGDLRLDTKAFAFPGEDGTIVPGKPDDSEFLHRVMLPLGDEDIMPAKGEPLSKAQQDLLRQWISEGAEWPASGDQVIAEALEKRRIPKLVFELPALEAGEAQAVEKAMAVLRTRGAVVQRLAADTEAIDVNFSLRRDQVGDAEVRLLAPLAKRLVWLDLSRTGIGDDAVAALRALPELRRLNLANTKLGDGALARLAGLPKLEVLNVYGTGLGDEGLLRLAAAPNLRKLYVWQTKVTKAGAEKVLAAVAEGRLALDLGDYAEARLAAAQQEVAEQQARKQQEAAQQNFVNQKCPVSDAVIDPAYFVEHEGKRIAFCCGKCKAKFEKDPKAYLAKLPK